MITESYLSRVTVARAQDPAKFAPPPADTDDDDDDDDEEGDGATAAGGKRKRKKTESQALNQVGVEKECRVEWNVM